MQSLQRDDLDVARLSEEVTNLRRALETRDLIGMAKGIIIARERCDPEEAFRVLSRASQRENRKLIDLAREIVDRNARPEQGGDTPD